MKDMNNIMNHNVTQNIVTDSFAHKPVGWLVVEIIMLWYALKPKRRKLLFYL